MSEIKYWVGAAAAAVLLGLIPMAGHAAPLPHGEEFCELFADSAQVAAKARAQGLLLNQFKSKIAQYVDRNNVEMRDLLDKIGTMVYTSDEFADLTPEQSMREAYRGCMSVQK